MPFSDYKKFLLELGFRESGLETLENYIDFLWESNETLNLVSRKMTYQELIENHLIDCLLPLKYFPPNLKKIADFGSGGGLPGIVYAIQFPDAEVTLFEKSQLKRDFLNQCLRLAPNLKVMSEVPVDLPGTEIVISRAFKSADTILTINRKYYESGGSYFLMKAKIEKIDEDLQATMKKFKKLNYKILPLKSPLLEVERHILWINPPEQIPHFPISSVTPDPGIISSDLPGSLGNRRS